MSRTGEAQNTSNGSAGPQSYSQERETMLGESSAGSYVPTRSRAAS